MVSIASLFSDLGCSIGEASGGLGVVGDEEPRREEEREYGDVADRGEQASSRGQRWCMAN